MTMAPTTLVITTLVITEAHLLSCYLQLIRPVLHLRLRGGRCLHLDYRARLPLTCAVLHLYHLQIGREVHLDHQAHLLGRRVRLD